MSMASSQIFSLQTQECSKGLILQLGHFLFLICVNDIVQLSRKGKDLDVLLQQINRGYYMAARRYEISLRVLPLKEVQRHDFFVHN